eukprot:snap_masked-scaffold_12-processed-gene-9.34-mRNA-1 protein AED:0.75 eAED:1.00 QI:0/-1/0/1/-1/1/1/0/101
MVVRKPIREGKEWSAAHDLILIGNVYKQLFVTACLDKECWHRIYCCFNDECERRDANYKPKSKTTVAELKRHFSKLQRLNQRTEGKLFKKMYDTWKELSLE